MDFGIDTIIYIILGIVFLVAQASKKKKAQTQRVTPSEEEEYSEEVAPPSSLLEEFLSSRGEQLTVQNTVEENFPEEDYPSLSSNRHEDDEVLIENLSEKKMEDLPKDEIDESDDQKERSVENSDFDLRNAVIYSAILERKYF